MALDTDGVKLTREGWILANQVSIAIACLNAPFCGDDHEPDSFFDDLSRVIAKNTTPMALEDAIGVLQKAAEIQKT